MSSPPIELEGVYYFRGVSGAADHGWCVTANPSPTPKTGEEKTFEGERTSKVRVADDPPGTQLRSLPAN